MTPARLPGHGTRGYRGWIHDHALLPSGRAASGVLAAWIAHLRGAGALSPTTAAHDLLAAHGLADHDED